VLVSSAFRLTASTPWRSSSSRPPGRRALSPEGPLAPGPWGVSDDARGQDYDRRFAKLAASGVDLHGEATFVEALGVRSVLDAGCGTGRVAIELARRGLDVVGLDADPGMLSAARAKAPELDWVLGDLSGFDLSDGGERRRFDAVVMAGNVMIFVVPGTEGAVVDHVAAHLRPGGLVVAGFQLIPGRLSLDHYDDLAASAGLTVAQRFATWDGKPWTPGGDYAVSVHRLGP
jgi:SAM-dependent methyltransferase